MDSNDEAPQIDQATMRSLPMPDIVGPDGMTPDQYMVETRTILNEHLISCAKSNAIHTTILVVGLTAILAVAGFGLKGLYDNVNAQAKALENTMHELTTRDRIITTDPQGRTVTRAAP